MKTSKKYSKHNEVIDCGHCISFGKEGMGRAAVVVSGLAKISGTTVKGSRQQGAPV